RAGTASSRGPPAEVRCSSIPDVAPGRWVAGVSPTEVSQPARKASAGAGGDAPRGTARVGATGEAGGGGRRVVKVAAAGSAPAVALSGRRVEKDPTGQSGRPAAPQTGQAAGGPADPTCQGGAACHECPRAGVSRWDMGSLPTR